MAAAGQPLSVHVTSCSSERKWSLFGNNSSHTKSRLALEWAKELSYVRSNNDKGGGAQGQMKKLCGPLQT